MNAPAPQRQEQQLPTAMRPVIGIFYPMLAALLISVAIAAMVGAALSGLLAGSGWAWPPVRALPATLARWVTHPGNPADAWATDARPGSAVLTYTMAALVAAAEATGWVLMLRWRRRVRDRKAEQRSGLASARALDARLGRKAVVRGAARLRPSLAKQRRPDPDAAGARFAAQRFTGSPLYATHEDSKLVVTPVRMGKTGRQAVADVVRAPGAVMATSTRFDLLELTMGIREQHGRVMVFDPEGRTPLPRTLRWSPIAGCGNYDTAQRRAVAICSARPLGDTKNGGYFTGQAEGVMAALLHAAALAQVGVDELRLWTNTQSRRPAEILDTDPRAAFGVAAELRAIIDSATSTNDSSGAAGIYATLSLLLRSLASPSVRAACSPHPDDEPLDVDAFVRGGRDTLYLVSRGRANSAAPIVNALAKEVLHRAELLSQHPTIEQLSGPADGDLRLDPPLRAVLDEAANVSPLDDLASLMADSGGRGIQLYVYAQSMSQLRQRWGPEQALEIWDNASIKLVLGGMSASRDLEEISRLLTMRDIAQTSVSTGTGSGQVTVSQRRQRALTGSEIRELPEGQALLLYRNVAGTVVDLLGWWETPDLRESVQRSRAEIRRRVLEATGARISDARDEDQRGGIHD
ncbi:type IV secretory system conjugative DNA transfer family protein [Actinokineospora cianjurensis]|uniref:Type IV secretory pathway TraG/TraD family ATPase VirD4 n=1 Tax=Actinokineospora cianjurensis TaxID=585224 RepID=A0A421B280_9PSEU|nr:TraM recognition domain-containing protein [Actinokineospora cianjurensis]RLK58371.1 type IV secretory pathway TraG/TraD family ATPase VirD4 [Actinokineospora cianjurensis]